jgi:hypothetical protein
MTRLPSEPGVPAVSPATVRRALLDRTEIAILDVRPEGRFAEGHPLFAASFPLGRLETEVFDRLPPALGTARGLRGRPRRRRSGGRQAPAPGLRQRVSPGRRPGGLAGWTAAGGELLRDVNAPSKAFGELVAVTAGAPSVAADEGRTDEVQAPWAEAYLAGSPRPVDTLLESS